MSGHTPGPWRVGGGTIYWTAPDTNNDWIVAQVVEPPVRPSEEAAANARLIAGAPQMAYALRIAQLHLSIVDRSCAEEIEGTGCGECLGCSAKMAFDAVTDAMATAGVSKI